MGPAAEAVDDERGLEAFDQPPLRVAMRRHVETEAAQTGHHADLIGVLTENEDLLKTRSTTTTTTTTTTIPFGV